MRRVIQTRSVRNPLAAGIVLGLVWAGLVGCAGRGPLRADLADRVKRPNPRAVLFLCDGLRANLVERGCEEGWLPNLNARFFEGGTRVENAVTAYPCITYAAIATILTGVSPARHGITGNRWFDADARLFRDYATISNYRDVNRDFDVPTLYERLEPLFTTSIQAAHVRGVDEDIANWAQSGVRWYFQNYTAVDALTARTVELVARRANRRGNWPEVLTCYFPGADTIAHVHGAGSDEYRRALVNIDRHVGRVCDWLESENLLEGSYLVLLADHGNVDVRPNGFVDLPALVGGWGRRATDRVCQGGSRRLRAAHYDNFDTVVVWHDGRNAMLHLAGPDGWDAPPAPDRVAAVLESPPPERQLWNQPWVDLVAYLAGEGEALLRNGRGCGRVLERRGRNGLEYAYVAHPGDPLGYLDDPVLAPYVATGFHAPREWLDAACTHEFPDVVSRVIPLLRHRRGGQALIACAPGYSFQRELAGHGGIRRAEMRIPLVFAGPGIPRGGTIHCAHAVDVVPTLLALLGRDRPQDELLEGVPLFPHVPARGGVVMKN